MTSAEPDQPEPTPTPPKRDWIAIMVTALPGLAALIAVTFTYFSVKATENQLQIARQGQNTAQQGQITDRYNAAITNLGSPSIDIRLGGIYALQRLMQDSPRDQPTVIAVLCAFVRDRTMPTRRDRTMPNRKPHKPPTIRPPTDIQAALTVVGTRKTANDGHANATVVDLDFTRLARAQLGHGNLSGANLSGANFTGADLSGADLIRANLHGADLTHADLHGADLTRANLQSADLIGAYLPRAYLHGADLFGAFLDGAELSGADLTRANLFNASLTGVDLTGVDLTGANLSAADLTRANFTRADLRGADLRGANLTDAIWPADAAVPKGWLLDTHSGRLKRTDT